MMACRTTQVVITGKKREVCEHFVVFARFGWVRQLDFYPKTRIGRASLMTRLGM